MKVGFALCGSFCTYSKVFPVLELLRRDYTITPIFSDAAYTTDTRFGTAKAHIRKAEEICGVSPIHTITEAEPIGPKKLFDILDFTELAKATIVPQAIATKALIR